MDRKVGNLNRGISSLEKKIAAQIDKIDETIDRCIKNVVNELGRLRELHQSLTLKREVLHRTYISKDGGK